MTELEKLAADTAGWWHVWRGVPRGRSAGWAYARRELRSPVVTLRAEHSTALREQIEVWEAEHQPPWMRGAGDGRRS